METRQLIRTYEAKQRQWKQEAERMLALLTEDVRNDIQEERNGKEK